MRSRTRDDALRGPRHPDRGDCAEPGADEDAVEREDDGRWLAVDRGPFRLCANFADGPREVPLDGQSKIILATGSAEPYTFVLSSAVTVIGRAMIVRFAPTNVML